MSHNILFNTLVGPENSYATEVICVIHNYADWIFLAIFITLIALSIVTLTITYELSTLYIDN